MKTLLLVALLLLACQAAAEIGTVKNVSGEVQVEREGRMLPVEPGFELSQDDAVITGKDGRVGIIFIDNSRFSAGPNSRLELARFRFNPTTHEGTSLPAFGAVRWRWYPGRSPNTPKTP